MVLLLAACCCVPAFGRSSRRCPSPARARPAGVASVPLRSSSLSLAPACRCAPRRCKLSRRCDPSLLPAAAPARRALASVGLCARACWRALLLVPSVAVLPCALTINFFGSRRPSK
ncbi:hypothetical protein T484DRAFT_1934086 [Baffinella frigidus]|nr:hypothetical protein T484DRAFT_1934086 [Cryptophyta sp. CCMP2293]